MRRLLSASIPIVAAFLISATVGLAYEPETAGKSKTYRTATPDDHPTGCKFGTLRWRVHRDGHHPYIKWAWNDVYNPGAYPEYIHVVSDYAITTSHKIEAICRLDDLGVRRPTITSANVEFVTLQDLTITVIDPPVIDRDWDCDWDRTYYDVRYGGTLERFLESEMDVIWERTRHRTGERWT